MNLTCRPEMNSSQSKLLSRFGQHRGRKMLHRNVQQSVWSTAQKWAKVATLKLLSSYGQIIQLFKLTWSDGSSFWFLRSYGPTTQLSPNNPYYTSELNGCGNSRISDPSVRSVSNRLLSDSIKYVTSIKFICLQLINLLNSNSSSQVV